MLFDERTAELFRRNRPHDRNLAVGSNLPSFSRTNPCLTSPVINRSKAGRIASSPEGSLHQKEQLELPHFRQAARQLRRRQIDPRHEGPTPAGVAANRDDPIQRLLCRSFN